MKYPDVFEVYTKDGLQNDPSMGYYFKVPGLLAFGFPVWKRTRSLFGPSWSSSPNYLFRVKTPRTSTHHARDRWTIFDDYTNETHYKASAEPPANSHLPPATGWDHASIRGSETTKSDIFVEKSYLGKDDMGKL